MTQAQQKRNHCVVPSWAEQRKITDMKRKTNQTTDHKWPTHGLYILTGGLILGLCYGRNFQSCLCGAVLSSGRDLLHIPAATWDSPTRATLKVASIKYTPIWDHQSKYRHHGLAIHGQLFSLFFFWYRWFRPKTIGPIFTTKITKFSTNYPLTKSIKYHLRNWRHAKSKQLLCLEYKFFTSNYISYAIHCTAMWDTSFVLFVNSASSSSKSTLIRFSKYLFDCRNKCRTKNFQFIVVWKCRNLKYRFLQVLNWMRIWFDLNWFWLLNIVVCFMVGRKGVTKLTSKTL